MLDSLPLNDIGRGIADTTCLREAMSAPVVTLQGTESLAEAKAIMLDHSICQLPVVDSQGRATHILYGNDLERLKTLEDIFRLRLSESNTLPVQQVYTVRDLPLATPHQLLGSLLVSTAAEQMASMHIRCVLVTDLEGVLEGILTTSDLLSIDSTVTNEFVADKP